MSMNRNRSGRWCWLAGMTGGVAVMSGLWLWAEHRRREAVNTAWFLVNEIQETLRQLTHDEIGWEEANRLHDEHQQAINDLAPRLDELTAATVSGTLEALTERLQIAPTRRRPVVVAV